jgi:carboxypeptidase Taq
VREAVDYHRRIPAALVEARAELGSVGQDIWARARAAGDFAAFAPHLEKTVALNREMAEHIGYDGHPYDALMHRFEPGETVATLKPLFARLREAMLPLVRAIADRPAPRVDFLERGYPAEAQLAFGLKMAERIGYDLTAGGSTPRCIPFEVSFTRQDVRITTRINEHWMPMSLFGSLHEAGHALYEQNVDRPTPARRSPPTSSGSTRSAASASARTKASRGSSRTTSGAAANSGS